MAWMGPCLSCNIFEEQGQFLPDGLADATNDFFRQSNPISPSKRTILITTNNHVNIQWLDTVGSVTEGIRSKA